MANCPKCGKHLRLVDWKQHCPHCGANVFVYDIQERLMQDADIAEVQYYSFQKKIDRLKASFVGSRLAIARIVTSLLPVGPLFLPLAKLKLGSPFEPFDGKFSLMTVINSFDKIKPEAFLESFKLGKAGMMFSLSAVLLVLSVLLILVHFILLTLACSPKGKIRNIIIDVLILLTTVGSAAVFMAMPSGGPASGTLAIGAFVYIFCQIVNVGVDIATLIKGIEIHHKQCYVGGIPIEEYFEMLNNGATHDEIRKIQYEKLQIIQDEKEARLKAEAEKKAAEEAERNNG